MDEARCACGHDAGDHPFDVYGDARRFCCECVCGEYEATEGGDDRG